MAESHIDLADGELVSDFEFILPWDVIETCCSLKPQGTSCFVSLNKQAKTSNQLFVSKLEDNSIKIRIRVVNIDGERNKESEIQNEEIDQQDISQQEPLLDNVPTEEEVTTAACESSDAIDRKQPEEAEKVEILANNPETTEILNKMITEEKDSLNKSHSLNKSNFSEGLSTVIIVKKVSAATLASREIENALNESKSGMETNSQPTVNKENLEDDVTPVKNSSSEQTGFTSVKERVVEKEEKRDETLNTSVTKQVTCELCFQQYESYSHLVRHVRKQHRDCTFVRNYLEEIRPLTITPCPICKRNFTAKSSLDAHLKVSHGGQFVRIKNLPIHSSEQETKKTRPAVRAKRRSKNDGGVVGRGKIARPPANAETLKADSESEEDSDSSGDELINGKQKVKCDVCNESFETRQQALKHQDRVHRRQTRNLQKDVGDIFPCKYCDKKLRTKELLLKHCLGTHFKSNDSKKSKQQQQSASEDEFLENEKEDVEEEEEKEVKKTPVRKRARNDDRGPPKSSKKSQSGKILSPGSASSPDAQGTSGFVCDLCSMEFNRMTLLVTHARYCRKSTSLK